MKRFLLLLIFIGSTSVTKGLAQELSRWSIGLGTAVGPVNHDDDNKNGILLSPFLNLEFAPGWHARTSLLLPIANRNNEDNRGYTSGVELSIRKGFKIAENLSVNISTVGLYGTTGPYKGIPADPIMGGLPPDPTSPNHPSSQGGSILTYHTTRWAAGIRPSVNYRISSTWSAELEYGFFGYVSDKDIHTPVSIDNKRDGQWRFDSSLGWGNAFRLGFRYTL